MGELFFVYNISAAVSMSDCKLIRTVKQNLKAIWNEADGLQQLLDLVPHLVIYIRVQCLASQVLVEGPYLAKKGRPQVPYLKCTQ